MEGKKALEREPFCVGTGRAVNDGRTKMGPAACFFLVRQRGFKLAFPDGEGEPLAVDRVDYKQPQAGCMVLGLKSFFFPQGRMVSILPSPKHTKKTALFGAVSFYFN
ncbi:hypothetical protein [Dialister hominis]|jgi:hypothetical protein|uniref:hypothetical protein n=1 Tax=Dialister hominis TaxID=2582419 RepID=UPI0026DB5DC1|nr:hypothetical protein [uncultured Dialister sp.]